MRNKIKCTVCGSSQRVRTFDESISLFQCAGCSHAFTVTDKPREKYLEDYFSELHKNWFEYPNFKLFEFMRKRIFTNRFRSARLLDVGCGNGDLLRYFLFKGEKAEFIGIDLVKNKRIAGIKFIQGDFFTYKIKGKFDVVCTLATIEHIKYPVLFVRKMSKLLLSEGLLLVMTIDSDSLLYWLARFINWLGIDVAYRQLFFGHHLQHFTKNSLRRLLENNGYEVVYQKNHNYPLKSVDVPKGNIITEKFYLILVALTFFISNLMSRGMLQTVICRKKT